MALGGIFAEKYEFGQHLTEAIASNLTCNPIYKQTTIQDQNGPKPEKALGSYLTGRGVVYILQITVIPGFPLFSLLIQRRHPFPCPATFVPGQRLLKI